MRILTKADKGLIAVLLVLALGGIASSLLHPGQGDVQAEVRVEGRLVKTIYLRDGYNEEFRIGGLAEYAIVETRDGRVRIRQDDSPRQIGVQTGWISKAPQQVVNLPYRIVINLVSAGPSEIDSITR